MENPKEKLQIMNDSELTQYAGEAIIEFSKVFLENNDFDRKKLYKHLMVLLEVLNRYTDNNISDIISRSPWLKK